MCDLVLIKIWEREREGEREREKCGLIDWILEFLKNWATDYKTMFKSLKYDLKSHLKQLKNIRKKTFPFKFTK